MQSNKMFHVPETVRSRDSSVGIERGCGLVGRVQFAEGAIYCFLLHRVQTGPGAHPASYPMGTGGSFPGGKTADV
jgi:hypothetical protein